MAATITKEMIARINELAGKAKAGSLTAEEQEERAQLRREYVEAIKAQVSSQLESIIIVDEEKPPQKGKA